VAASGGSDPGNERRRPPSAAEVPTQPQSGAPTGGRPAELPASSAAPVPYGQPQHYPAQYPAAGPPVVAVKTNGFAIASLVLGILWIYWIGSILALVFGMVAKNQIDRSGGYEQGRGMAIAGIVLGWVGIGFLLLFILFFGIAGCGAVLSGAGSA
jgi:hypothetical protein